MKIRYIISGLVCLELIALPVSASIIGKAISSFNQQAVVTELPRQPGMAQLVISSNAPFVITAGNLVGDVDIKLHQSGEIYTTRFGDNTQTPGPDIACAAPITSDMAVIYKSDKATSVSDAEILSQSVVMEVTYDYDADPVFKVMTQRQAKKILSAPACAVPPTAVTFAP
ncbi:MAG: hypothetical protein ACSHXY_03750 [Alphaproteobacteria bacterium]